MEDKPVTDGLLEIWHKFLTVMNFWQVKSAVRAVVDPITFVKLDFFSFSAPVSVFFFFMKYQTDKPIIPYVSGYR